MHNLGGKVRPAKPPSRIDPVIFAFTFTEEIPGGIQQSHILHDALTSQRVRSILPYGFANSPYIFFNWIAIEQNP
jgi:hypothetical protein